MCVIFYIFIGEKGLTFYIIISGDAIVLKAGIGQVAVLHKGHSFGELALTEGNDRRSATIRADTKVEILQLHKVDYDHFVKDIQLVERRENLHVLRSCKLFENWPRTKVQKMCNFCSRMTFKPEENIYCQGDKPDKIYFIIEGQVDIFKEVYVVVRNRWPTGMKTWEGMGKKRVKPFLSKSLFKDDFFGELVQDKRRTATATAKTRCTLLTLDRLEFTHLTSGGRILEELQSGEMETNGDRKILDTMLRQLSIKGGPSTTAQLNDYVKVINIKATKKKRQPSISAAGSVSSTVRNHLNTDQSIESNPTDCDAETDTINSDQSSFVSPVKVKKPRRVSGNSSGRKRPDSAASGTSETNESAAQGSLAEGSSDEEMDHFDSSESFAHGLNIDRNKATEFSLASSSTESARLLKHRHRMSAKLFEQHLSRASSACEDTSSGRAGKVSKKNSFNELMDSVSQSMHNNAGDNLQERQHQLQGKVAELREKNEVDVDSHLKLMVTEIVSAKKKIKYYDELAEMRFSAPEIVTNRTRKVNVINGHSLKFSGSTMKNYFMEPTKTVYCPSKNLKKSKKNPIVKITDERSPVMTSIKSVVMKSDKGRMVHSKLSQDINCYTDATKKKSPVRPATLAPLSADKSRLKLSHELSSYSEKEVFPPLRIPTPTKDFARQVSRNNMEGEQQKEVA